MHSLGGVGGAGTGRVSGLPRLLDAPLLRESTRQTHIIDPAKTAWIIHVHLHCT
jgi:hypothetical protein